MAIQEHLSELSQKHQKLDQAIMDELQRPQSDSLHLSELKRRKLRLKEEIERLRRSLH